jgi:hypothetical protein
MLARRADAGGAPDIFRIGKATTEGEIEALYRVLWWGGSYPYYCVLVWSESSK